jgi:WD40 repeat protein
LAGLGFSADGSLIWTNWHRWLIGGKPSQNQSELVFWSTGDGVEQFRLSGSGGHYRMYFDATGTMLATAGENDRLATEIWVWDLRTRQLLGEIYTTGGGEAGFSPDGKVLAVCHGTDYEIGVYSALPRVQLRTRLLTEGGCGLAPQFSADGRLLLTTGADIRLWGVPTRP